MTSIEELSDRARRWAGTMGGHGPPGGVRHAHASPVPVELAGVLDRAGREDAELRALAPGATRAAAGGNRPRPEEGDPWRTCFERDRDRILHDAAFRRLAGKTQVFVFPLDHQRTRLTHALEVAQVSRAIAAALRLNVALAEAVALGHDCGHGPFGHASEDALDPLVAGGFDHALWGADITLAHLNLTEEVSDGIRNHSWSRAAPSTPEGEVVALADRIAYTTHDAEDAAHAGVVDLDDLPAVVRERVGASRSRQLDTFITDVVTVSARSSLVAMSGDLADALAALRAWNYERIYLRPESLRQATMVHAMLRALVGHYVRHPADLPMRVRETDMDAQRSAVAYVAGMTDRFACAQAERLLGWPRDELPAGFDV